MSRWCLILFLAAMALPAMGQSPAPPREQNAQPNTFALTIKTGDVRLGHESQTISGNDWLFERSATDTAAIEGETRLKREAGNLSLGGEVLRYNNRFRLASAPGAFAGTMYTRAFLAKSKYYFMPESVWQPYVGGGFGIVWSYDYSGPLHTSNGLGYQGVVGMQLRADRVGLRMEYMALRAHLSDDKGGKIDASSRGVFVGLSFFFGRR